MNLILQAIEFIRKISPALAADLEQLVISLNAWGSVEHRPEGRHKFALVPIPFLAGNFTGNGSMTWTVTEANVAKLYYRKVDTIVTLWVLITGTTVGGVANTALQVLLPPEIAASEVSYGVGHASDNAVGTPIVGVLTGTLLQIFRADIAAWTLGTTAVRLTMEYEVAP